jgi:hypothetical protein
MYAQLQTMLPMTPVELRLECRKSSFENYQKDDFQAILPSNSTRGTFFPNGSRASCDRLFARIANATTPTIPRMNPTNTNRSHLLPFPIETIKEASYECHEDVPRWWKSGVTTSPFKLCNLGLSFGPARIFRSARFVWRVWMELSIR